MFTTQTTSGAASRATASRIDAHELDSRIRSLHAEYLASLLRDGLRRAFGGRSRGLPGGAMTGSSGPAPVGVDRSAILSRLIAAERATQEAAGLRNAREALAGARTAAANNRDQRRRAA